MHDSEFHQLVDQLMLNIEQTVDCYLGDSDYERSEGTLTLTLENGSKIIINRQEALQQVWLAAKTGGYHFNYQDKHWCCVRSGKPFFALLSEIIALQCGEVIYFNQL